MEGASGTSWEVERDRGFKRIVKQKGERKTRLNFLDTLPYKKPESSQTTPKSFSRILGVVKKVINNGCIWEVWKTKATSHVSPQLLDCH
jgi:hypothetical protein